MQVRSQKNKPTPFATALEQINNNDSEFKVLNFSKIIVKQDLGDSIGTVSNVSEEDLDELAVAIKKNTTIEEIFISIRQGHRTLWEGKSAGVLGESLKDHPKLSSVTMYVNSDETKQVLGFLNCFSGSAGIQRFILHCTGASNEFLSAVGKYLAQKQSLKYISIYAKDSKGLDEEDGSIIDLFYGLGAQQDLVALNLQSLNIPKEAWPAIGFALKNITQLQMLGFLDCSLSREGVAAICEIAKNNPQLSSLNLSQNPFIHVSGAKILARYLPGLPKLRNIDLSATGLIYPALEALVTSLLQRKTYHVRLSLSGNPTNLNFIGEINRLIKANPYIKTLNLNHCFITKTHLQVMKPILQDPKQCFLESIHLDEIRNFEEDIIKDFIHIMQQNNGLKIVVNANNPELKWLTYFNEQKTYQKKWEPFIDAIICLAQACFSFTKEKGGINSLDKATFFLILSYLAPRTLSRYENCSQLIFNNLQKRKALIEEKKYLPSLELKNEATIHNRQVVSEKWWHKESKVGTIFVSNTKILSDDFSYPQLLEAVTVTLPDCKSINSDDSSFYINLKQRSEVQQHSVKDIFDCFFKLYGQGLIKVIFDKKESKLMVAGISLEEFKEKLSLMQSSPLNANKKHCIVM